MVKERFLIHLRNFDSPERIAVQNAAIQAVKNNYEQILEKYKSDPRSFQGRYICADLFKEFLPSYSEDRNFYNAPVHNSAAALAGYHFFQSLQKRDAPEQDTVVFITGIPGAGKTSAIFLSNNRKIPDDWKFVFEGQLATLETSLPKVQAVLDAGLNPIIKVVHPKPEIALQHTFKRFDEIGRGAGINIMAKIQGELPDGLQALYEKVGEQVELEIYDSREQNNPKKNVGWEHLNILKSEGDYANIKQRLEAELERARESGTITEDCYRQAAGRTPRAKREMEQRCAARNQEDVSGRRIQEKDSQKSFLRLK